MQEILADILKNSLIPEEFHDQFIHNLSSAIAAHLEDYPFISLNEFFYDKLRNQIEIHIEI